MKKNWNNFSLCVCIPRKRPRKKHTKTVIFRLCVFISSLSVCLPSLLLSLSSFFLTHRESVAGKRITDVLHLLCVFVIVSLFFVDMCIFIYLSRVTQVTNIKSSRLRLALFVSSQSHFIIHSFFFNEYSDAVKIVVVCRSVCFFLLFSVSFFFFFSVRFSQHNSLVLIARVRQSTCCFFYFIFFK